MLFPDFFNGTKLKLSGVVKMMANFKFICFSLSLDAKKNLSRILEIEINSQSVVFSDLLSSLMNIFKIQENFLEIFNNSLFSFDSFSILAPLSPRLIIFLIAGKSID